MNELQAAYADALGWPVAQVHGAAGGRPDQHQPDSLRSQLLTRAQLADLPQPEPLIEDTLDRRTVALLAGRHSTGKSFLALDWSCCVATGRPWQGRPVAAPGRVLYVAAEGAHGLHQRVTAWEHSWGRGEPVEALDVLPRPVNLYSGAGFAELLGIVAGGGYRLTVVDTWARSTVGGRENDNSDSTVAFERVDELRRVGGTVLVVAHTDLTDSKARGATALEDNVDSVYRLRGDASFLELSRTKRKDGPTADRHALQLRPVLDSCVVQSTAGMILSTDSKAALILSTFVSTFGGTGASKAEWRSACAEAGITSSGTFSRGVSELVKRRAVVNHGSDLRPFYKLPEATA